jgi:hypothetical protein
MWVTPDPRGTMVGGRGPEWQRWVGGHRRPWVGGRRWPAFFLLRFPSLFSLFFFLWPTKSSVFFFFSIQVFYNFFVLAEVSCSYWWA